MKRRFNTAGPCIDWMHYMIPPLRRLPEAPGLVEQGSYVMVHALSPTGKTTVLRALAKELTASGKYAAMHLSCEAGQAAGEDFEAAEKIVVASIGHAGSLLPEDLRPPPFPGAPPGYRVITGLSAWAAVCPRPIVLFFDEIDALQGASLIAVLRQLRDGFPLRPHGFPASVVLCGLRDVRDYKAASGGDPSRLGTSSPFNIKVASLRLGDFSPEEVRELYAQHTAETGQVFSEEALARAIHVTAGQPWLVNALAREIVELMAVPPEEPVTEAHVEQARERLILARATHLDSLVARLHEPRVKRFIEPILAGTTVVRDETYDDSLVYCRDLGLIARSKPLRIANPIYHEVIARVLAGSVEEEVLAEPRSFVLPDGRLAFRRLLGAFAAFWREHGDVLAADMPFHEVAPQLVLMAFLQRIVNGGGYIDREYGIGRGRIDVLVRWPYLKADGQGAVQRRALEMKVWRSGKPDPRKEGLRQLDEYLARLGLKRGVLVIFDRRREAKGIPKKARFEEASTPSGRAVTLLRA